MDDHGAFPNHGLGKKRIVTTGVLITVLVPIGIALVGGAFTTGEWEVLMDIPAPRVTEHDGIILADHSGKRMM